MRVIGGKDFYDSARAFGEDPDTVFVRHKHSTAEFSELDVPCQNTFYRTINYYPITVIFAGKSYHGVHYIRRDTSGGGVSMEEIIWTPKHLLERIEKDGEQNFDEIFNYGRLYNEMKLTPEKVCCVKDADKKLLDFCIDHRISIAILDEGSYYGADRDKWMINTDGLKAIDFAKVLDPYTAFQELSMFVGGVLPRNPNPMVELSGEKIMVQKHGFDKWTFRRQSKGR